MLTYQAHFISQLKKMIREEIQRSTEIIANPNSAAIPDYAQFRFHVGIVQGLRMAEELCDEAEAVIDGRDEKGG